MSITLSSFFKHSPNGSLSFIDETGAPIRAIFCFTGKAPMSRSKMEALAIKAGASITKSITNKTTILVAANQCNQSTKIKKAISMGINLISPKEFFQMCEHTMKLRTIVTNAVEKAKSQQTYTKSKTKPIKKKHSFTRRIEL
jgi:BRCT domain type II-containing protein